jgi:hypothetical protein
MKKIFFSLLSIFIFNHLNVIAQPELSVKIGNEIPMGELKWVYKNAPSISVSYSSLKYRRKVTQSFGVGLGFLQFKPKESFFYYLLNDKEYGTVSYSNYNVFQLFVPIRIDFLLSDKFELFGGLDFGYYYVFFEVEDKNKYIDEHSVTSDGKGSLAPKCGINYNLSPKIGINLQAKYNAYFSLGTSDAGSTNYNSNLGGFNQFFSTQIGSYIRF